MNWGEFLPIVFLGLMGLSMFLYVVLDGFDLGIGMLLHRANKEQKDRMIASIGPFWDANETWLVLGVGILLIAFPKAHGLVMTSLYLPIAVMLIGLILRGVAFDFRVKAQDDHKPLWNFVFFAGSTVTALAQGWMLGRYITGFAEGISHTLFAAAIALALPCAYVLMGATWLVLKTDGNLQQRAAHWGRLSLPPVVVGMLLISAATPLVSASVADRWFALPQFIGLLPIPFATFACLAGLWWSLGDRRTLGELCWLPFVLAVGVFLMGGLGLAYSLYPYVVMDRITIWQAASSQEALTIILIGCAITVPTIIAYTFFAHRVFWGKATELRYG